MDTRIGGGTQRVLLGACRLAAGGEKPGIWTDDLLRSLLQHVAELGAVLDFPAATVAFHRDYVFGGRTEILPAAVDREVQGALREAHWHMFGLTGQDASAPSGPWWEAETVVAVRAAAALAVARGHRLVGRNHLLEALLSFPDNRARHYVQREWVDEAMLDEAMRRLWPITDSEPPMFALAEFLGQTGVLGDPSRPPRAGKGRLLAWATRRITQQRPVLVGLEQQAVTEAVRLGHAAVGLPHLLLAVLTLEEQLAATGLRPLAAYAKGNSPILGPLGITHASAIALADPVPLETPIATPQERRAWHGGPRDPRWTVGAARAAQRAGGAAGSVQLLGCVLSDEDDSGRRFLASLGVEPGTVEAELSRFTAG